MASCGNNTVISAVRLIENKWWSCRSLWCTRRIVGAVTAYAGLPLSFIAVCHRRCSRFRSGYRYVTCAELRTLLLSPAFYNSALRILLPRLDRACCLAESGSGCVLKFPAGTELLRCCLFRDQTVTEMYSWWCSTKRGCAVADCVARHCLCFMVSCCRWFSNIVILCAFLSLSNH